jgi:hypothetical protein
MTDAASLTKLEYDVLNAVALRKMVGAAKVAELCDLPPSEVEPLISALADRGLLFLVGGQAFPADQTEAVLADAAGRLYRAVRADAEVTAQVDRFEAVNGQLLTTMSAWQQVQVGGRTVANDHSDPRYDDRVIDRVGRLVQRLTPLIEALVAHDPRFGGYRRRFDAAVAGVDQGRHELVSSPVEDSVHTIWFEFHEDLLRTLGRARAE